MNSFKVLTGNTVVLVICALVGVRLSTTDKTREAVVTGSVRASHGVFTPFMRKRMINLLIIVLRAVAALAKR